MIDRGNGSSNMIREIEIDLDELLDKYIIQGEWYNGLNRDNPNFSRDTELVFVIFESDAHYYPSGLVMHGKMENGCKYLQIINFCNPTIKDFKVNKVYAIDDFDQFLCDKSGDILPSNFEYINYFITNETYHEFDKLLTSVKRRIIPTRFLLPHNYFLQYFNC